MDINRWKNLSEREQYGAIAAEVARAMEWENKDRENFKAALEQGIKLVDLTLDDPRHKGKYLMFFRLKEELGKFYVGAENGVAKLYAAL